MFAGLLAQLRPVAKSDHRTRDHSELALRAFGATVERQGNRMSIQVVSSLRAIKASVPAIFLPRLSFSALPHFSGDRTWLFDDLLLNPTRSAILDVLSQLGLEIRFLHVTERNGEGVGSVQVRQRRTYAER